MKNTSSNAIRNIEHVLLKCKSVNEHQLIGFNFNPDRRSCTLSTTQRNPEKAELYSITLQIKVLSQLPELIWKHLDNDEFFIATQLFILARHINTGLRLNKTSGANGDLVVARFPLVKNQWAILQQFFGIIKDRCNSRLETEDLLPEVASRCLASLILLDSPGVDALLQSLLNSRLKAFCDVLNDNSGKFSVVRDKLLASLTVLNNTVLLVHKCFVDDQQGGSRKGLLAVELNRLSSDTAPYTISHVISMANSKASQFLPDIIAKYRPSVPITEVPLHAVQNMMRHWLSALTKIAGSNVRTLVNLIGSVKVIREIMETSMERESMSNSRWSEICGELEMPKNMNFYREFYHALIDSRVKEIIQSSWTETQRKLTEDIDTWLDETAKTPQNMSRFIWTEEQTDVPLSLRQALDPDLKKRKLLMKSRGFVGDVLNICQQFDKNLEALYKDVNNYLARDGHSQLTCTDELRGDQEDLIKFLIAASRTAIQNLVTGLRVEKKIQDKESLLQMARLFQAIRDLCPYLRLILCYRMDGSGAKAMQSEENWMLVGRQLEEESIAYWLRFADQYFVEWCVSDALSRPMDDYATVLEEFAAWQSVTIEEKDEQGNAVQSTIRVPSQPSVRLQTTLFRVVAELNKIAPHTIPTHVIGHLIERITGELLDNYEKLNESEFVRDNQHVSLQFYFDIRYVTMLLIPRDVQNKLLPDQAQRVQNLFKSQVDPFDFELFFVQLTKNVKTAAIRSHNQLGVIIPNLEHLMTVLGGDKQTTTTDKTPNVLPLSSTTVTWFPLLPIAAPIVKETDVGRHGEKKTEVEVS